MVTHRIHVLLSLNVMGARKKVTNDVRNIRLVGNVRSLDGILDHLEVVASCALVHPSCSPCLGTQLMDRHVV